MKRLPHLDEWVLLAIASSFSAVWLGLWVQWSLAAWFEGPTPPLAWPAGLALAGLLSASLTRLALRGRHTPPPAARAAVAGLGALAILLLVVWAVGPRLLVALWSGSGLLPSVARAVPPLLAASYAWWQGEQLGRGPLGHWALRSTFYSGVLALAPLLVMNRLLAALSGAEVIGALLLFFGLALSGLALSSLRQLRRPDSSYRPDAFALGRQWLLTSAAVIGMVLGAGLLAARWVAPEALERLAEVLGVAVEALALTLAQLLGPVVTWLLTMLAPVLPGLSDFLERFISTLALVLSRLQSLLELLIELVSFGMPRFFRTGPLGRLFASPVFQAGARWAGLLVVLAVAVLIFWFALRRLWGQPAMAVDEQRDSVFSGHLLLAQLKSLLRRRPPRWAAASPDYLSLTGAPDDARLIIRRAYQGMLEWAQLLRLPRAAGQTPRAYAQMLAGAVPEGHDAIDLLTQAYVLARYAAEMPSLEQARRAEGAVARLKALHS